MLDCECPSDIHPPPVAPILSWIACRTGKRPKAKPLWIDLGKVGNTINQPNGIFMETCFAIEQVLDWIIGAVADERLRIDH